jgi:dihydrofolate reductase
MVRLLKELSKTKNVYIIGGAMMYSSTVNIMDQVLVTKVDADGEAEVFFPNLDENPDFEGKPVGEPVQDGDYTIRFWTYKRK